jgi:hypothetical protein
LKVPARDVTHEILAHWRRSAPALPAVEELGRYLDTPFPESAKIPLDHDRFNALVSNPLEIRDRTDSQDVTMLFRIHEEERAETLLSHCLYCVTCEPPADDATESSFHMFWDVNLRRFLEVLIPGGQSIRDSSRHMSTAALRPDFGFLYLNICPFRGEEKSVANTSDPKAELCSKMIWTYDPAPYVLGELLIVFIFFPFRRLLCILTAILICFSFLQVTMQEELS